MTPFAVKLETYLRMTKIPYECVFGVTSSAKGKLPWMTYNGADFADSQFCIDYLNAHKNIDLNSHLTKEQRAIGRTFQYMTEEHMYWILILCRWVFDDDLTMVRKSLGGYGIFVPLLVRRLKGAAYRQGVGRHSYQEVMVLLKEDMKALSVFIVKYPNLGRYCDRMKDTFWPDWNECITHGFTRDAPK